MPDSWLYMQVTVATTIGFKTNGRCHGTVESRVPLPYHSFENNLVPSSRYAGS